MSRRNASRLGIKQLEERSRSRRPAPRRRRRLRKNQVVTGTVTEVNDGGIEVELEGGVRSFIRRADLARDRNDQRPERFGKGDKVDAMVTSVDKASRKVSLSIKAREVLGGEGSRGPVRLVGLRRLAGRHPGRGAEEEDARRRAKRNEADRLELRWTLAPAEREPGEAPRRGSCCVVHMAREQAARLFVLEIRESYPH